MDFQNNVLVFLQLIAEDGSFHICQPLNQTLEYYEVSRVFKSVQHYTDWDGELTEKGTSSADLADPVTGARTCESP